MPLDTNTDVGKVEAVVDKNGTQVSPSNEERQKEIRDSLSNNAGLGAFDYSTSSTTAETLPSNAVPDGVAVLVQAKLGNASVVNIGNATTQPVAIEAGQSATFEVSNTDAITIQTPTSGDGVGVVYENG